MSAPHMGTDQCPNCSISNPVPSNVLWNVLENDSAIRASKPTCEVQMRLQVLLFVLAPPCSLWPSGKRGSKWNTLLHLSVSFWDSNFQINRWILSKIKFKSDTVNQDLFILVHDKLLSSKSISTNKMPLPFYIPNYINAEQIFKDYQFENPLNHLAIQVASHLLWV